MISEIDIRYLTELYKLQKGDNFEFADDVLKNPPDPSDIDPLEVYRFLGVDGMYVRIRKSVSPVGTVDFVAAWTKVKKV